MDHMCIFMEMFVVCLHWIFTAPDDDDDDDDAFVAHTKLESVINK